MLKFEDIEEPQTYTPVSDPILQSYSETTEVLLNRNESTKEGGLVEGMYMPVDEFQENALGRQCKKQQFSYD